MQQYFAKQKINDTFLLQDEDLYHIKTVMRMDEHDKIQVIYEEKPYLCCLQNVKENIQIKIEKELQNIEDQMPKVTLLIPLLKEQKMDYILQKATELGVDTIIPIETERSIIKYEKGKMEKKQERWQRICKEASEQSFRTRIPTVTKVQTLEEVKTLEGHRFICSTTEKNKNIRFALKSISNCDKIIVAIGPEGGFSNQEEQKWNTNGFQSITLGNRILRVETVPLYILSIINFYYME